ncbi:MAG: T9SS type A sorting domain-containing protein [Chitinophagaceae bacterium]|jgi:hypothetical protein|nr:T9SS type A sorting domain-containing protein [Chitinophagaceae bacterium]OQY95475.1 MAG: hypothetical protein B6D37_05640 [Sphingobacteriales bacterium UTBCD1]
MKSSLLLFLFFAIFQINSKGQIEGPSNGNTFTVVAIGGSSQTWQNPGNVAASDNTYATFGTISAANGYTDYLVVTNFGFNIPSGSTITGIMVEVERSDANFRTMDNSIKIVKGGIISGDERAVSASYPLADAYQQYGNAGDTWGLSWTYSDINATDFGVAVSAKKINNPTGAAAGKIDNIRITVFYDFAVLPVNLISFSASKYKRSVTLNWVTANEINMTGYDVQRSNDGINFSTIASLPSNNSISTRKYGYVDGDPPGNILYYRLKMTGLSGYSKYSKVIMVSLESENKISLYPNPAPADRMLHIAGRDNRVLNIRFFDAAGRLLSSGAVDSDNISLLSLRSQKGMVIYQVTDNHAQVIGKGKLVLQ